MSAGRIGLILAVMVGLAVANAHPSNLPPLPRLDLSDTFPGVRNQIREAEAAAHAHPNDTNAVGKLGMVLDAYQQYVAAAICYRRAHLLAPSVIEWVYDLAYVEMKLGQYTQAAATFRAVLKARPDFQPAMLHLAECLLSTGRLAESRSLLEALVQKNPDNADAYYDLGRVETQQGETEEAVIALEKACQLFPQYGGAHYTLALDYRKLGQMQKASEQFAVYQANPASQPPEVDPFRAAVQQLDQSPGSYLRRGLALERAGDLQGAIQAHLKAIQLDPNFEQPHINLIQLYARAGEYSKAEQEYRIAVGINPHRSDCYYKYGVLMFQLGKYAQAEQAFRRALSSNPYYPQAHNNLGFLLQQQGHLQQALEEFQQAIKYKPDYRLARFHLGQILVIRGDYARAIEQFQRILEPDDAETPTYLYVLGITYARAGDLRRALENMRRARAEAEARGQTQLLASINHDLKVLENSSGER